MPLWPPLSCCLQAATAGQEAARQSRRAAVARPIHPPLACPVPCPLPAGTELVVDGGGTILPMVVQQARAVQAARAGGVRWGLLHGGQMDA